MATKLKIIEYLKAYQETGNRKFLARALALQIKFALTNV